ncbi:hypothetical protein M9194_07025 [Vibrio sp. S4M6]|uniref:hypothetical protein n=1 Tax=Vibrio sinus TaxID=2946865 RepID=UPI00202A210D|nr:hypothetical protein [Vibrio sinus]MCL9781178.1 hypothetical protein [Vibrio sinus]
MKKLILSAVTLTLSVAFGSATANAAVIVTPVKPAPKVVVVEPVKPAPVVVVKPRPRRVVVVKREPTVVVVKHRRHVVY